MSEKWFALLIESGRERRIMEWLAIRQQDSYWPKYRADVKLNRHRRGTRWRGVIPGYLFLPEGKHGVNFRLILEHPYIHGTLRSANDYAVLTEGNIQVIRD